MQYERFISKLDAPVDIAKFSSINQNHAAEHTSQKYSYIPTTQVISVLEHHGWFPVLAIEMNSRKEENRGFQKHMLAFRNQAVTIANKDQLFPQIILTNSHDGLASFCLQTGIYRLVCGNGLVVADSMLEAKKIRHMGYTDQAVSLAIEEICDTVPTIGRRVNDFQVIDLTPDEKGVFAQAALIAKYGEDEVEKRDFNQDRLLAPVRYADQSNTLWSTFNVVQEKLISGGRFETKTDPDRPWRKKTGKARAVNSISENIRINQALWMLTEKMAELKGIN